MDEEFAKIMAATIYKSDIPTGYIPETPFLYEDKMVYNLRQTGWSKGKPEMSNDVAIYIQGNHLSKSLIREIAETLCEALNRKYVKGICSRIKGE
jgi:hypothetical protein